MYDESPGFFKRWLRIVVVNGYVETANVSVYEMVQASYAISDLSLALYSYFPA